MADNIADLMKKAFLAGVGAAAEGTEKADALLKEMVRKGELTVEQGKALNQELRHKVDEKIKSVKEDKKEEKEDVSSILKNLSAEDLKELKRKLDEIDLEEDDV